MFVYTLHAIEKLKTKDNKLLKISKKRIEEAMTNGLIIREATGVITVVGKLDKRHSLCVVYRLEDKNIVIITFFAAEKGRYESKILQ